jgi:hypothetical protein
MERGTSTAFRRKRRKKTIRVDAASLLPPMDA